MNVRTALFEICRWVAAVLVLVCLLTMFGGNRISEADPADVEGFDAYIRRFRAMLAVERAAVENV